ncbi:MAG: amidohydrolase family protein, partial [Pseudomonadales bacterium]
GHVPIEVSLEHAVASRMQTMEHLYGFIRALQKPELNADMEWRFADAEAAELVSRLGSGELQLDDLFDESGRKVLIERVAADDVWIVPTFSVLRTHEFTRLAEPAHYLHPSVRRFWEMLIPMVSGRSPESLSGERKLFDYQLSLVGDLYRAGGRLLVGTDAPNPGVMTGFAVAEEIALMERAGLSKLDALRAATLWPAQYMNEADVRGHVSVGAVADLILLDADPLQDLSAVKAPDTVFRSYPDASEPYTRVYSNDDLTALLDKVDAEWVALEAELAEEPELGDESLPRYSFAGTEGARLAFAVQSGDDALTTLAALKPSDSSDWQRFELGYSEQGGTLTVDGREYSVAPETGALQLNGAVLAQAEDAKDSALILTRTVADLPVLWSAMEGMEQGDQRSIGAWLCPQLLDCSDARYTLLNVRRLEDSVTDGAFYYTGVQQFAVSADDQPLGTVLIGGGPFYGGQPVAIDVTGWPLANMERLR